ncbi:MAG: 16S rRNA (guanine(527)-N(7))-methyltransferase RsmG, partial [Thermodesulfobacteriota bacterium]
MSVPRETGRWRDLPPAEILTRGAAELGVPLSPEQTANLLRFLEELRRWNRRINLMGPAGPADQIILHLLDSLSPLPFFPEEKRHLLDLGSGGGLPGLVLKLVREKWSVTLAESKDRKAAFLRHAVRTLPIKGVEVLTARISPDLPTLSGRAFDLITARAFGPLEDLLPLATPWLAPQGHLLAYKTPGAAAELAAVQAGLDSLNLSLETTHDLQLPFLKHHRTILIFKNGGGGGGGAR